MLLFLITVNRWLGLVSSSLKNRHLGKCADLGTLGLVLYGLDIREEEVSQDGASVRGGGVVKDPQKPLAGLLFPLLPHRGHALSFPDLVFGPALDKTVPAHSLYGALQCLPRDLL